STKTTEIVGNSDGRVKGVRFADGSELVADLVVMAVGIRPNTELAQAAGIHCERGIVVNDTMQKYDPKIYAVGECVAHRGVTSGLTPVGYTRPQAKSQAAGMPDGADVSSCNGDCKGTIVKSIK